MCVSVLRDVALCPLCRAARLFMSLAVRDRLIKRLANSIHRPCLYDWLNTPCGLCGWLVLGHQLFWHLRVKHMKHSSIFDNEFKDDKLWPRLKSWKIHEVWPIWSVQPAALRSTGHKVWILSLVENKKKILKWFLLNRRLGNSQWRHRSRREPLVQTRSHTYPVRLLARC